MSSAGNERARLFVALELPDAVAAELDAWGAAQFGAAEPGWRRVARASLHVTLCFLGEQPVGEVPAIASVCQEACAEARGQAGGKAGGRADGQAGGEADGQAGVPLDLATEGAVWLPPRRPRVLAVAIDDPNGGLGQLQARLARGLQAGRWYQPERRSFRPHVTVARAARVARGGERGGATGGARGGAIPPQVTDPPAREFRGDTVALMRSQLGRGGARYERVVTVGLG